MAIVQSAVTVSSFLSVRGQTEVVAEVANK